MEKTVEMSEICVTIGDVIRDVAAKGDQVVVKEDGKPMAVVVPVELYERMRQSRRKEFFDTMRAGAERANMSPEEADELAAEAVAWTRGNKDA